MNYLILKNKNKRKTLATFVLIRDCNYTYKIQRQK